MSFDVIYLAAAQADLEEIYDWIADRSDADTAFSYVRRLQEACEKLSSFPKRGTARDDLAPDVRTISFERKTVIAYLVSSDTVQIARVLHRGRDLGSAFSEP